MLNLPATTTKPNIICRGTRTSSSKPFGLEGPGAAKASSQNNHKLTCNISEDEFPLSKVGYISWRVLKASGFFGCSKKQIHKMTGPSWRRWLQHGGFRCPSQSGGE